MAIRETLLGIHNQLKNAILMRMIMCLMQSVSIFTSDMISKSMIITNEIIDDLL